MIDYSKYQNKETRSNFAIGVIGAVKYGKSTTVKQIAHAWVKANPGQDVISFDPQHNFTDITTLSIDPDDEHWPERLCKVKNCLVILDDIRIIHEQDRPMKGLRTFLINLGKNNVDLIHVCHNPSELLNILAPFTTMYYIFYTNVQEGSFKRKIPNYSLCNAASIRVNNYVSRNGKGVYPNFPCIRVNCEKQRLEAINMDIGLSKIKI